jgi:hypothetical protein
LYENVIKSMEINKKKKDYNLSGMKVKNYGKRKG